MQIKTVTIHNFRSIADCPFRLDDYSLMIGANNAGKTNVMDALRIFYEKRLLHKLP
jgi:predicted ATP-dependent endonuclease of OLD family